jgi:CheY-like chemotaxis protein
LPDIEGWRVLERLKNDVSHRHIPIYVISTEDASEHALQAGARRFLPKPIPSKALLDRLLDDIKSYAERNMDNVLVVGADAATIRSVEQTIESAADLELICVPDVPAAFETLRARQIGLMVLDQRVSDIAATLFSTQVEALEALEQPPILVLGDAAHAATVHTAWARIAKTRVVRQVESLDRLLDQSTLLLHRDTGKLPHRHRRTLEDLYQSNKSLAGKKVLIVDDDMRNIFALASVLEEYQMNVLSADNGRDVIRLLQKDPGIDAILMDIMMPEMDGLDTTQAIRALPAGKNVPIIAVTAKAMKGDRDRCLEAGAWDYLSKPVDREQLLATLRAWLHR